jgi:hypothetical protein
MTIPDFITWLNTNVNTNGIRGITGAIMNTALVTITNYVRAEKRMERAVVVNDNTSNIITFKNRSLAVDPFPNDTVYAICGVRVYDADGNNIDYQIISQDVDGFTISVAADGFLDYECVEITQTIPE